MKRKNSFHVFFYAAEKTRTSTVLLPLAPEASASANSATTAIINHFFILAQNKDFNKKNAGKPNALIMIQKTCNLCSNQINLKYGYISKYVKSFSILNRHL